MSDKISPQLQAAPGVPAHGALRVGSRPAHSKDGWLNVLLPNRALSKSGLAILIAAETAVALLVWLNSPFKVLPTPMEVLSALSNLWTTQGLGHELVTSFSLNVEALAWSTAISLVLSYLTVVPLFRPLVAAFSKGRFLSLAGFTVIFTVALGGGHALKLWLLVSAVVVFQVTAMASVVACIPREQFDHARTLRMSEWRVVWEVVVLGTADKAFEVLRQNAAMGWMMLTMVEGIVRSEGGVGGMIISQQKFFRLDSIWAIQLVILIVGMGQDWFIGFVRRLCCPYADLTLERK